MFGGLAVTLAALAALAAPVSEVRANTNSAFLCGWYCAVVCGPFDGGPQTTPCGGRCAGTGCGAGCGCEDVTGCGSCG